MRACSRKQSHALIYMCMCIYIYLHAKCLHTLKGRIKRCPTDKDILRLVKAMASNYSFTSKQAGEMYNFNPSCLPAHTPQPFVLSFCTPSLPLSSCEVSARLRGGRRSTSPLFSTRLYQVLPSIIRPSFIRFRSSLSLPPSFQPLCVFPPFFLSASLIVLSVLTSVRPGQL